MTHTRQPGEGGKRDVKLVVPGPRWCGTPSIAWRAAWALLEHFRVVRPGILAVTFRRKDRVVPQSSCRHTRKARNCGVARRNDADFRVPPAMHTPVL